MSAHRRTDWHPTLVPQGTLKSSADHASTQGVTGSQACTARVTATVVSEGRARAVRAASHPTLTPPDPLHPPAGDRVTLWVTHRCLGCCQGVRGCWVWVPGSVAAALWDAEQLRRCPGVCGSRASKHVHGDTPGSTPAARGVSTGGTAQGAARGVGQEGAPSGAWGCQVPPTQTARSGAPRGICAQEGVACVCTRGYPRVSVACGLSAEWHRHPVEGGGAPPRPRVPALPSAAGAPGENAPFPRPVLGVTTRGAAAPRPSPRPSPPPPRCRYGGAGRRLVALGAQAQCGRRGGGEAMEAGGGGGHSRVQGGSGPGGDEKPTSPWTRDRREPPAGPEKEQELVSAAAPRAAAESRLGWARVTGGAGRHRTSRGRPAPLRGRL